MAFRKRNVAVNAVLTSSGDTTAPPSGQPRQHAQGTRPSLSSSATVTSTGTAELDALLGGHGGLALGSSLLVGEHGTTDYAGALLRAYVAEGLLQGHEVHVVGVGKGWTHNLPGVATDSGKTSTGAKREPAGAEDKMKIAWRYENLGRTREKVTSFRQDQDLLSTTAAHGEAEMPFCHTFDLTRRLEPLPTHKIRYHSLGSASDPFSSTVSALASTLASASSTSIHRIVIPLLLSPALYPPASSRPENTLRFVHALRALLQRHREHATAMLSIPLTLFPGTSGLTHWIQHLSDGVIELVPFPYIAGASTSDGTGKKDAAQGMLRVLKLPVSTERGDGGAGGGNTIGEDLAFTLSRRKFIIEPFSLPPVEGDQEAQSEAGKITAKDVEF